MAYMKDNGRLVSNDDFSGAYFQFRDVKSGLWLFLKNKEGAKLEVPYNDMRRLNQGTLERRIPDDTSTPGGFPTIQESLRLLKKNNLRERVRRKYGAQ